MQPISRKGRRVAVQLSTVFGEGAQKNQGTVLNLSAQGCAMTAEPLPPVSTYCSLHVDLLNGTEPVVIELATVRWVSDYRCGLEFIRSSPEMTARLHTFVALLEQTP